MEKIDNINENLFINILRGLLISFAMTIISFLIFGLLLSLTNLSENTITPVIIVITGISILIGSSITCIKTRKKGLIIGGIIGISYFSILYIFSSILSNNYSININSVIMMIVSFISGMIGGVIGVNLIK